MTKQNLSKLIKRWNIASSDDGICYECPLRDDCKFRLEGKEAADSCYDVLAEWLLTHIKPEYKSPEITVMVVDHDNTVFTSAERL